MSTGCGELAGAHAGGVQNHSGEVAQGSFRGTLLLLGSSTPNPLKLGLERGVHVTPECGHRGSQALGVARERELGSCGTHDAAGIGCGD